MVPFDVYGAILNNRRFLGVKRMGERSAGNPHAAFDVEGTGDVHRPLRSACCPRSAPQLPLPDKPSIAVMPFANLSGDPGRNTSQTAWSRRSSPRFPASAGCP